MADKKTRILASVVFIATVLLSLLLAIKNNLRNDLTAEKLGFDITDEHRFSGLNPLEREIVVAFQELSIPDSSIRSNYYEKTETREIKVAVPMGKPMEEIIQVIQTSAAKTSYTIEDSYYSTKKDSARIHFSNSNEKEKAVVLKLYRAEDGFFDQNLDIFLIVSGIDTVSAPTRLRFLTFEGAITYEVPVWSTQLDSVATVLERYELPMIVTFPFESKGKTTSNEYTLRIDDSRESMDAKLSEVMRRVPYISGVSNDGGDRFLETRGTTNDFLHVLKDHSLFFVDYRTANTDRVHQQAKQNKVNHYRNVKELLGETTAEYTQELRRISLSARKEVILHAEATPQLIQALEKNSQYFENTGVTFKGITVLSTK